MKKVTIFTVIGISISLAQTSIFGQEVQETPAVVVLVQGGSPQGFIQGSNAQGIIFSPVAGRPGKLIGYNQIQGSGLDKLIQIVARNEMLGDARAFFAEGQYREAAVEFGKVADAFSILLAIPQNFATEARFFQIESLKRAGAFGEIAPLLETPAGKNISTHLGEAYQSAHTFHKLWGLYGAKKIDEVRTALEAYQAPVTGSMKLLREPNFKKLPSSELVDLAFLRAKTYAAAGEKEKALDDYYRVITLAFGNNPFLSKQAMGAAMVIQKEALKADDKRSLQQLQSLAFLFKSNFGTLPAAYQEYAVRPDMPKIAEPKEEVKPKEEAKPKEEKPKEAPKAAPADAKKPAKAEKKK